MAEIENISKDKKEKSKLYPRFNLEICVDFTKMLRTKFGKNEIDIETVFDALNTRKSRTFRGKLSASKQFGLIVVTDGKINFTEIAADILFPVPEKPIQTALVKAFQSAPLYSELIQKFDGMVLPEMLPNILSRNHGIAAAIKDEATKVFIESAMFAKVLRENNRLIVNVVEEEEIDKLPKASDKGVPPPDVPPPALNSEPPTTTDMQKIEIALSSGERALIYIPKKITMADIELLKLQLEVLKYQAEHFHTSESIVE